MEDNWTRLGGLIKHRRRSLVMNQITLGEAAKLSRSTIQKLEGGTARPEEKTRRLLEQALGWVEGSFEVALAGGVPALAGGQQAAPSDASPTSPSLIPLKNRLPKRVQMELDNGEVLDTEIYDLTVGGGTKIITVVIADPENGPQDFEELRRTMRAWERIKRLQHGHKPLAWEPGDPEEWKTDAEA